MPFLLTCKRYSGTAVAKIFCFRKSIDKNAGLLMCLPRLRVVLLRAREATVCAKESTDTLCALTAFAEKEEAEKIEKIEK